MWIRLLGAPWWQRWLVQFGVALHVRSIGDLSEQAVGEVRADPAGPQASSQEQRRSSYAGIIGKLIAELMALDASCPSQGRRLG